MKDANFISRRSRICAIFLVVFCIALPGLRQGWAFDTSGLELKLFADQFHADFEYTMDQEPVLLYLSIRNLAGQPIVTSRGYSQVELYNYIFVTDPAGVQHILGRGVEDHKMPPPYFINDQPWALAESLPPDWVRTVTFTDLRELLPMLRTVPGWYTIEASQPFIRFARSGQDAGLGLLGLLEYEQNWEGTIKSKPLQILVAPLAGAKLQVQVENELGEPLVQVAVKVFRAADLPAGTDPAQIWNKISPAAAGTTDLFGRVIWDEGDPCIPKGDYEAVALFNGEYSRIPIDQEDAGWQEGNCQGLIVSQIEASSQPGIPIESFALLALNGLRIENGVRLESGSVGVQQKSDGPWLCTEDTELCLAQGTIARQCLLYADTIFIDKGAVVLDVHYNELSGTGRILGDRVSPLKLPVAKLPAFLSSDPDENDILVKKTAELNSGSYGAIRVGARGALKLTGGTYHFESLTLDRASALICQNPCTIRVKDRIALSNAVSVGPAKGAKIMAGDIVIYAGGQNGEDGLFDSTPKAIVVGKGSSVQANIFVPYGTLLTNEGCSLQGAFIGRDILIGKGSSVSLASAF